jgi:hypothetical protein
MHGKALTTQAACLTLVLLLLQTCGNATCEQDRSLTGPMHATTPACMHGNALTPALTRVLLLLQTYGNTTCEGDRGLTGVTQISSEEPLL